MPNNSGDLKQNFVLKAVQQYISECEAALIKMIARKKIGNSNDLISSIRGTARMSGNGATAELLFKEYGRYIDMGVGRSHPLGGLAQTKLALKSRQYEGNAFIKDKKRSPKKFYSPTVYGKLTYLENKLLHGYTEETIAMLKQELSKRP